ncbi:MAG TPA: Wzz/FepE/Etk N-terminal domain-containing protein [Terracidiphilus sp.]|jgi:polysaccharide chain length determinant protein (PEP-CTERM system associated)
MEDYAAMLKRRFWLILIITAAVLAVSVGVSFVLPPKYESQTLVLIEQQRVPEDYVKPVVDEDLSARLASMKEQILSRSRIEPIITKFNLFSGGDNTMDDRVDLTRKAIKITQIHSEQTRGTGSMPGFFVSFDARDARTAQQVCGEITSLFVTENLSAREQSAEGTSDFLRQQLDDAKRKLDDQDAKLAAFQEKYIGRLPGQEASNANSLQALTTQLDAATQSVNRMQQSETFLEAMVSQQTHDAQSPEPAAAAAVDERQKELKDLKAQKQVLDATYTPDHPDVVAINRRIADLEAQIAKAASEPAAAAPVTKTPVVTHPDSPQVQQLKAQLEAVRQSIVGARQEQGKIAAQIRSYESRIDASPQVEEEYKQVTRDHDTALEFYNSLLKKMNDSSMATALEQRQQGEQFVIMDAPNLPDEPSFPNRYIFAGGGFAGGLMLGLLIAALLEYRDTSLRNERDIWAFTKLPTLAIVAHIDNLPQRDKPASRWNPFSRANKPIESAGS